MKKFKDLDQVTQDSICQDYYSRLQNKKIHEKYDISNSTFWRVLRENHVKLKTKKYDPTLEKKICQMYKNTNTSVDELCSRYSISTTKLTKILKRNFIQLRSNCNISQEKSLEICARYISGDTIENLSKEFKTTRIRVLKALRLGGVERRIIENLQDEEKILTDFKDRFLTYNDIASKYKISLSVLIRFLESKNIPKREKYRTYFFDEKYLTNIDTPDKAQILGFLYADGCVSDTGKLLVALKEDDKEYLLTILNKFGAPSDILRYRKSWRHMGPCNTMITSIGQYSFTLHSKILYESCNRAGLIPRKSWVDIEFPNETILPKQLRRYFILGLLEGDGTIYVAKNPVKQNGKYKVRYVSWLGSAKLIEGVQKVILEELGSYSSLLKLDSKLLTRISYKSKRDLKSIIAWLYSGTTFCLHRKHQKAQEILSLL